MAGSRSTRREMTLRPTRWPGPPRGGTLLRVALIAGLLALASGVLYAQQTPPDCAATGAETTEQLDRSALLDRSGPLGSATRAPSPPTPAIGPAGSGASDPAARLPLPAGMVGVPIRLAEPAALAVVRPGVRVDLLAVPAGTGPARPTDPTLLASQALVLDVVDTGTAAGSAALYLALRPDQARQAIGQPEGSRFAIIVRS